MSSFGSVGLFWCQVTGINQTFPVHKKSQLFSAVVVENQRTYFGAMSCSAQKWLHKGAMCDYITR